MSVAAVERVTAKQLLDHLDKAFDESGRSLHPWNRDCPGCNGNLRTTAIVSLCYTFEVCKCDAADFDHLVEQLWHRACFQKETE